MPFWKNKYLVQRRDGTIPEWPWFVLSAKDPSAADTLRGYAYICSSQEGIDPDYISGILDMANEFDRYRRENGVGDPAAPPHRKDDMEIVASMPEG